jgi:YVTN family beta-propeller protein
VATGSSTGAPPPPARIVVLNAASGTIKQIDEATNHVVSTTRAGTSDEALVVAPDGKFAFVGGSHLYRVSLLGASSTRELGGIGGLIAQVALNSTGLTGLVIGERRERIALIDTTTNKLKELNLGSATELGGPLEAVFLPNGRTAYVSTSNGFVVPVYTSSGKVGSPIDVGGDLPDYMAATPNGLEMYVVSLDANDVTVIDTTTNKVVETIDVGRWPGLVVITPNGKTAYVGNFLGETVSVINVVDNKITATIAVGDAPGDMVFSPDGKTLYVVVDGLKEVTPIRVGATTAEAPIKFTQVIGQIVLQSDGRGAYLTTHGPSAHQVIPLNLVSKMPGKPIDVGKDSFLIEIAAAR